jgi:GTP cyclohydrolase I
VPVKEKGFVVDAGIADLPFPIRAISKLYAKGQPTVANISVRARIMQEFEARWIDRFIQLLHSHREQLCSSANLKSILDGALEKLDATAVHVRFDYPFFVEKLTPIDREKCLVRYSCWMSGKTTATRPKSNIRFGINAPIITTYPTSVTTEPGGLFGQLSVLRIEMQSEKPIYPEVIVEMADQNSLQPIYSFLTEKDQLHVIKQIHSMYKPSVATVDAIKEILARDRDITYYEVNCFNYGMLHNYSTSITVEKSAWVPFTSYEELQI